MTGGAEANGHAKSTINVLSLFSGAGGMDLGFAAAGYKVRCAVDNDARSCETLELNQGKREYVQHTAVLEGDIRALKAQDVYGAAELRPGDIDFVIGGPPCQAFSVFGRRAGLADPRGGLVWEFLRLVSEIEPFGFVFENVGGLKSIHEGRLYGDLHRALSCDGTYQVTDHAYDVSGFGVPQFRYRVIFVGLRNGQVLPQMRPTHAAPGSLFAKPWVTVRTALRGMPAPGSGVLANHRGRVHSQRIIDRYAALAHGERDHRTRINKLHPDRPSFTIIVGSDAGGGKGHIHPFVPREVTPRESARLQTFPDWWEFAGTGRHVIRQVGNAVPPLFAAHLGTHIAHEVYGWPLAEHDELVSRLGLDFLRNDHDNRPI